MTDLRHKVALVTGSSRGIGAAIARRFAAQGARVALHGRDVAALSAVRDAIEAAGGQAMQVTGDVTKFDEIESIENHAIKRLGTPEDIADAALFLASERSSWISGVILDVAGER